MGRRAVVNTDFRKLLSETSSILSGLPGVAQSLGHRLTEDGYNEDSLHTLIGVAALELALEAVDVPESP
jgi:hypothetical protein